MYVHSYESNTEMLFECCDGPFCSVDSMVVQGDELDVDLFRPDVFFNRGRTFIAHNIQCRVVSPCFEGSDHFSECSHHGCICAQGNDANNDCIEIIDICNKHILHTFEQANKECTGDVSVHCASDGVGQCGKAKQKFAWCKFLVGGTCDRPQHVLLQFCFDYFEWRQCWICAGACVPCQWRWLEVKEF